MNKETYIMRQIELTLSAHGYIVLRQNSGMYYSKTGQAVRIGFPGLPDLLVIRPDGKVVFLEVKPDKSAHKRPEQIHFIETMKAKGIAADFVYTAEESLQIVRNSYEQM